MRNRPCDVATEILNTFSNYIVKSPKGMGWIHELGYRVSKIKFNLKNSRDWPPRSNYNKETFPYGQNLVWMVDSAWISQLKWRITLPSWSQKMPPIPLRFESVKKNLSTLILIDPGGGGIHTMLGQGVRGQSGTRASFSRRKIFEMEGRLLP